MSNAVYPYRVDYPRTSGWWGGNNGNGWVEGDWSKLSTWCDSTIGKGEWDYYGDSFVFCTEASFMLFKLKWL